MWTADGLEIRAEVLCSLNTIPEAKIHTVGMRPLCSIYNLGFDRVLNRFEPLVGALEGIAGSRWTAENLPNYDKTLESLESLLYSLMEHVDDCRSILRALFDFPSNFKSNRHVRKYDQEMHAYRNHIGAVVNAIKHRQGRLRALSVFNPLCLIPGYYIETAFPDGSIGPDVNIHDEGDTAFSFYENCRYHFANLFKTSFLLSEAVRAIVSPPASSAHTDKRETELLEVANRVSQLPRICFLDEIVKPSAAVEIRSGEHGMQNFEVKLGVGVLQRRTLNGFMVKLDIRGVVVDRKFKVPYLGNRFTRKMENRLRIQPVG